MQHRCLNWNAVVPALTALIVFFTSALHAQAPAQEKEADNQPPPSIAFNGFGAVALSPDGKWFAASGAPGTTVRMWDSASGKELHVLEGHEQEVRMALPSHDGKLLFTGTRKEVRVWDVATGKQLQCIPAPSVRRDWMPLTLSGDDKWFLSNPEMSQGVMTPDGRFLHATIRLWEVATGKEARRFQIVRTKGDLVRDNADYYLRGRARSDEVLKAAVSHDGKYVAAGTRRGLTHVWDAATGKEVGAWGRPEDFESYPMGFSRDGKWLITSVYTTADNKKGSMVVRVWELATGKEKHTIKADAFKEGISDDGKWVVTGIDEKTVKIWDVEAGKEVRALPELDKDLRHIYLSMDRTLLATYDDGDTVRVWDPATGKQRWALKVDPELSCIRLSADGKLMVTWSAPRLVLWDLQTGKEIRSLARKVDE